MNYHHQQDVVYGYKDGMGLIMDILTPTAEHNRAGVVWIIDEGLISNLGFDSLSRGTLSAGLISRFKQSAHCLLEAGYVVFAVAHSSTPKYRIYEVLPDLSRAVRFVRCHAERFGIDPHRIGITGSTSGGGLALITAAAPLAANSEVKDPVERVSSHVRAVVAHNPFSDNASNASSIQRKQRRFSARALLLPTLTARG